MLSQPTSNVRESKKQGSISGSRNQELNAELDRITAEKKLKESEARLRQITDNMRDLVSHFDTQGIVQYVCPSVKHVMGYDPDEIIGRSVLRFMHPDDIESVRASFLKGMQTGCWERMELRYRHFRGHYLWFEAVGNSLLDEDGKIIGATLGSRDITDRKEVERKLHEQVEFLQLLIDTIPSPLFYKDAEGRYQSCNLAFAEYLGVGREELVGKSVHDAYPEKVAGVFAEKDGQLYCQPGVQAYEATFSHSDGSIREVIVNKATFSQGDINGIVGVITDITSLKQAEEALADGKERLAVTLGSIGEGVITTDREGRITMMNRLAEEMTGWPQTEAIDQNLDDVFCLFDPQNNDCSTELLLKVLEYNSTVIVNNHQLRRRDGRKISVTVSISPIHDRRGRSIGIVMVVRDITAELELEEELLRASKLESLGVLAGGIAHDFNNLMTVVLGSVSLSRMLLQESHEADDLLAEAEKAVKQARSLTQQLLTFARGGKPIKKPIHLYQLLKEAAGFALSGSNVKAEINAEDDLWTVEADFEQISQVFNNLILNAMQAMPHGGIIKVSAENITLSGTYTMPLCNGGYVRVSVKDAGIGIPKENQAKIFDPYFTTKFTGSGLGLATAYSIIKSHDGHIEMDSTSELGTIFQVYLPASTVLGLDIPYKESGTLRGQGRILVMDDDPQILLTAQRMLKSMGYEAVLTTDGAEAISIYQETLVAGKRFAAVLMDLTVPGGIGGRETIQHLLAIDPEVNAIVSSGYSNDMVMNDYAKWGFKEIIPKPYTINELSRVLHQVIGDRKIRI